MSIQYQTLEEVEAIVRGFETYRLSKADFTHRNHLTVALWYLNYHSFEDADALMRAGLMRFIEHHDVPREKFNETITMFWLKAVQAFIEKRRLGSHESELVSLTNELLQHYPNPGLVFEYYSRELVFSEAARIEWVAPDVKGIDLW